jgi:repressor LexA
MPAKTIRKKSNRKLGTDDLTDRQEQVLAYVLACWGNGFIPAIRKIGEEFGITSPNGVMCHIRALCVKGYMALAKDRLGYQLTDKAMDLVL